MPLNSVVPSNGNPLSATPVQPFSSWLLNQLMALRTRAKISKLGKYSAKRVESLEKYCQQTSPLRVILVCTLMPWPALILELIAEWIPLQDPSSGWKANIGAYIRLFIAISAAAGAALFQIRSTIPRLSPLKMAIISGGGGCCAVVVTVVVARFWVFPVPFSFFIFGPCVTVTFVILLLFLLRNTSGRASREEFQGSLRQKLSLIIAQVLLATVYITFNVGFARSSSLGRVALVLFLPVMKISLKHLLARLVLDIPESIPTVVVFTVDVFNGLYTSICMQSSGSWYTSLLMIFINIVYTVLSALDINRTAKKFQELDRRSSSLARKQQAWNTTGPESSSRTRSSSIMLSAKSQNRTPTVRDVTVFTSARSLESARLSITAMKAKLSACLLFQMEYRTLVGYIETVIPLLYAVYISILVRLPSAQYYPHARSLTSEQLKTSIALYSASEIISLTWLHMMVKRKLGFSLFYQLAFVLETEMEQLQGRLFVWIIILLQITLTHFGMDFTFRFAWLDH